MKRVNYRAKIESGEIQTYSDLMKAGRREWIAVYKSRLWPKYIPGPNDVDYLLPYIHMDLEDAMDFGTFCAICRMMKEKKL